MRANKGATELGRVLVRALGGAAAMAFLGAPAATQVALATDTTTSRHVWIDHDADGLMDFYTVGANREDRLLRNLGDGRFEDVTLRAGLAGNASRAVHPGDFDRDDDRDLLLVTLEGRLRVYEALEGGAFQEATAGLGLRSEGAFLRAEWLDYDGDGWLDLALETAGGEPAFRHNVEGLAFETIELGLAEEPQAPRPAVETRSIAAGKAVDASVATAPDRAPRRRVVEPRPREVSAEELPLRVDDASGEQLLSPTIGGIDALAGQVCARSLRDLAAPGSCLRASSLPTLGMLYPLSSDLFVDSATGFVGMGTTAPGERLHVFGNVQAGGMTGGGAALKGHFVDPTLGYLGVQGYANFDGITTADWPGYELGVAGISTGGAPFDNWGVLGHSNGVGVRGEFSGNRTVDYAELGLDGVGLRASGSTAAAEFLADVVLEDAPLELRESGNPRILFDPRFLALQVFDDAGETTAYLSRASGPYGGALFELDYPDTVTRQVTLDGGAYDKGGEIVLANHVGTRTVFLDGRAEKDGGTLALRSSIGDYTVRLMGDSGSEHSGSLALYDGNLGKVTVQLDANASVAGGTMKLGGFTGATTVELDGAYAGAGRLQIYEEDGSTAFAMLQNALTLHSGSGATTIRFDRSTGTKSAVVGTASFGRRRLYAVESPEVWFEDFGGGELVNGEARVPLDPIFLETVTIDAAHPMRVFVTPSAPSLSVWVEKGTDHFVVRALGDAQGPVPFDWRVVAKRRGLESTRLERGADEP